MDFPPSYEGCSIFRNQPPYTHFDKPFNEGIDMLLCCVNEINPYFLEQEDFDDEEAFKSNVLLDPRTKAPAFQPVIDHTSSAKMHQNLFKYPANSLLSTAEHVTCLHVMKAMQHKFDITRAQATILEKMEDRRKQERIKFMEFLYNYCHTNHENIFAPAQLLVDLYKRWYKKQINVIIQNNENTIFQVHSGLPCPKRCGSETLYGEIKNLQILNQSGTVAVWNYEIQIMKTRPRIAAFFEKYCDLMERNEWTYSKEVCQEIDDTQFVIPEESLLFLMCVGDYIDLPTEVLITIRPGKSNCPYEPQSNSIEFQEPLPSRNCGTNTNLFVAESAIRSHFSLSDEICSLELKDDICSILKPQTCEEIQSSPKNIANYNIKEFDAFMKDVNLLPNHTTNKLHSGFTMTKWTLALNTDDKNFEILTKVSSPLAVDVIKNQIISINSLKLEYKPQLGCEHATKSELLRDWIKLTFFNSNGIVKRHRIDVTHFRTQLEEETTLAAIEEELRSVYQVKIPQLLGSIGEFLSLLSNVNPGNYMLRFNPKFKDKIMLCAPAVESTTKTISLHSMLQEEVTDLPFMISKLFLPISSNLCSIMHDYRKVLPCAFPPKTRTRGRSNANQNLQNYQQIIDDKSFIEAKLRKKAEAINVIQRKRKAFAKALKRSKKKIKNKAKAAQIKKEKTEIDELQEEIEIDKILYEFQE